MSTRYEFIALRRLNAFAQQSRKLHMTGPSTYPSKLLASKPIVARVETEPAHNDRAASSNGRSFNTSRELNRNKDSSTMDFTYLPSINAGEQTSSDLRMLRFNAGDSDVNAPNDTPVSFVTKPEISTTSLNTNISPMSEVHDNAAVNIDFHTVTEQVNKAASKASKVVASEYATLASKAREASSGTLRSLWNGVVEDMVGSSRASVAKPAGL